MRLKRPEWEQKMLSDLTDIRMELEREKRIVSTFPKIEGIEIVIGMTEVSTTDLLMIRNLV